MHIRWSHRDGQVIPPCLGWRAMRRERDCTPPSQRSVHAVQSSYIVTMQSIGAGVGDVVGNGNRAGGGGRPHCQRCGASGDGGGGGGGGDGDGGKVGSGGAGVISRCGATVHAVRGTRRGESRDDGAPCIGRVSRGGEIGGVGFGSSVRVGVGVESREQQPASLPARSEGPQRCLPAQSEKKCLPAQSEKSAAGRRGGEPQRQRQAAAIRSPGASAESAHV